MKYRVILQRSEEGVAVSVPGFPGCWSQGSTEAEALENIRSAIQEYLAVVDEQTQGAEAREVEVTETKIDDRATRYDTMVKERKACRLCECEGRKAGRLCECEGLCKGLVNASVLRDGEFDSDQIGPWTRWLGDLHARILVVGQDWGGRGSFERLEGRDVATGFADRMLRELLRSVGIQVPDVCVTSDPHGVFLTNAVLCFKDGGDQAPVRSACFKACGPQFLRPQIELINPKVVVGLGEQAYRAVLSAYALRVPPRWCDAVEGPGVPLDGGPIAFAVYHCSARGQRYRNWEAQLRDWQRIAAALTDAPEGRHDNQTQRTAPGKLERPGVPHLQAVRALEKAGFRVVREGKHIVTSDGQRILTIPQANPINAYTMGGIIRGAGLSIERFKALL